MSAGSSVGSPDGSSAPISPLDDATVRPCRGIVALGASAGGLAAFERFFRSLEPGSGLAFVVVQHLSPEHESILPQLLSAFTKMPVEPVTDGTMPAADRVYVIPPKAALAFRGGRLRLDALEPRASRQPISALFSSLAAELGRDVIAIVLSGTGSDGAAGLRAVRARGGMTLVQSPSEAQYDSMPRSALATGDVDVVVSAADMPALIARELDRRASQPTSVTLPPADPVVALTEALRRHTGKEFGAFKRTTLLRRVQRRLTALGIAGLSEYAARLDVDEAEARTLTSDLMIGVTRFFRDRDAFAALEEVVLPKLLEFAGNQPVRVWVPGCASGEEAYSLAILLANHAERLAGPTGGLSRIQVFATDINEAALAVARVGHYPATISDDVPPDLLARYFVADEGGYSISREIRDSCIFSVHDVLGDPPFSRLDLVSCRNLLIYIDPPVQARLLPLFHYALRPSGFLFLGSSETVGDLSTLFEAVDKKQRIFRRSAGGASRVPFPLAVARGETRLERSQSTRPADGVEPDTELVRAVMAGVLDDSETGVALVDARGAARYFGGPISRYLPTPTGAPTANILELATGDLKLELSAALQAAASGFGEVRRELALGPEPGELNVVLTVKPLVFPGAPRDHFLVQLREGKPPVSQLAGAADERTHVLEGELRVATDRWRHAVQDLESTNEELRSANEELQTMNEELQSSNEELQLSQEELQSVNEELNTVNSELAAKVEEVNGLYADLQNLFQSTRIATVVLDRELCLTRFTPAATRLYPLAEADVGRPLANLADPFADSTVLADARAVLEDLGPRERILELAGGGRWHLLRVLPYLSLSRAVDGVVLTFVDVTELKRAEAALREAQEREGRRAAELEAIMRSVPAAVLIAHDPAAARVVGNDAAYRLFRMPPGRNLSLAGADPGRAANFRVLRDGRELAAHELDLQRAAATGNELRDVQEEVHFDDGTHVHLLGHALPLLDRDRRPSGAVAAYMDVTRLKDVEDSLRASEARFRGGLEALLDAFAVFRPVRGSDGKPVDFEPYYLNAPARTILRADETKRRLREFVPDGSPLLTVLGEALERGTVVERMDAPAAVGNDEDRVYDLRASPLGHGEVVVAWRDVTERTRATEALRHADRRKDEFIAALGHELRNPLAALQTALHLEQQNGASGARPASSHIDLMRRQVRTLGRLVDDLLDVTRMTRGKVHLQLRSVDLVELVRAEFALHERSVGDRLRLTLATPPAPLWVQGDPDRITQMAGNLIANACKFTEPGGRVEVAIAAGQDGRGELVVRDDGIGMTRETLTHLFEPFWQADATIDRARGGLGLGLSLVKGMAELMGADVLVRSDGPGMGSEFRVRFLPGEPPPDVPEAYDDPASGPGQRLRILVVEDNQDVRETLLEFLDYRGHEVRFADNGETGVAIVKDWAPELVFCDIGLPKLDGYAFASIARGTPSLAGTVLVAMTGYGSEGDIKLSRASGFDHHFTKPLDLDVLERFLDKVAAQRPVPQGAQGGRRREGPA